VFSENSSVNAVRNVMTAIITPHGAFYHPLNTWRRAFVIRGGSSTPPQEVTFR
jgi:hypothetical protein